MEKNITILMIILGSLVMVASILKYYKLFSFPLNLSNNRHTKISNVIKTNFVMMVFFFLGYIITASMLIMDVEISILLIGSIFFFGALFVFSVIFIQIEVSDVINEIYSFNTVEALVNTIEAKDEYTRGHSKHVASLCECMYDHLPRKMRKGMNKHMLRYAGFLHDIGKIGVSDSILNKDGPLTDEEWLKMKEHPRIGRDIIQSNIMLSSIGDWILYHHERVDGTGYYGLKKDEIPLEAKIISVADCFSALTTDRSYHKGKKYDITMEILHSLSGSQLDPELITIFTSIDKSTIKKCIPDEMESL